VRVVVDCNVLVSAARTDGVCRRVLDLVDQRHQIVLSESVVAEYERVARRRKHVQYRPIFLAAIDRLKRNGVHVEPANASFRLCDPDDEVYLATALSGSAALITGNHRDFTEPYHGEIQILSPRMFIERYAD